jgi:1-deoxy-D-xylulose-5-phosphate synthase
MAEHGYKADVKMLGIPDRIVEHGKPAELQRECGYDAEAIKETARALMGSSIEVKTSGWEKKEA